MKLIIFLGIEISEADMEKEMDRLGFSYTLKDQSI